MTELILVLALHVLNATAAIELSTENIISLNKALKLSGQVGILTLQALGVLLESITLSKQVSIVSAVLRLSDPEALYITPGTE